MVFAATEVLLASGGRAATKATTAPRARTANPGRRENQALLQQALLASLAKWDRRVREATGAARDCGAGLGCAVHQGRLASLASLASMARQDAMQNRPLPAPAKALLHPRASQCAVACLR